MLADIYKILKTRGLCRNESVFCREWLQMSRPYLAVVGDHASLDVLFRLAVKLSDRGLHDLASKLHEHITAKARAPMPVRVLKPRGRHVVEEQVSA